MRGTAQIEIRRGGIDDCTSIAQILYQSFLEYKALYTADGFSATTPAAKQIKARMRAGPVWVALLDGAAVGTVSAVKKGVSGYIRGMAVLPTARGSGAGSELLRQVEVWASDVGCSRLFLSTTPFLDVAIRLYEKFGFRRVDEGPDDLFGTPLFTMEKYISPARMSAQPSRA